MKRLSTTLLMMAGVMWLVGGVVAHAQTATGKLHGAAVDAESGEPLVGVNILIENTQAGAATNLDGEYFVLNLPPGNYSVRASYVGYQGQVIREVRIVAGVTTDLNFRLSPSAVEVGEITITAERPLFEAKATNTVKVYDSQMIAQLPVRGVERVAGLEAGVVSAEGSGGVAGNPRINVRGGRDSEVLYIIDGIPQNSILTGDNIAQVSDNAVEQVAFQVGGYEAKYGQAQSGIVNVTTKTGTSRYSAYGEVVTSSFTDDFGYNLYSMNLGGPIIPDNAKHTMFISAERGWFKDADPSAIGVHFTNPPEPDVLGDVAYGGVPYDSKARPGIAQGVWRFTGRTFHNFDFFTLRLGANYNARKGNQYNHYRAKNTPEHFPRFEEGNQSYSAKFGKDFSPRTYLNLTFGFKQYDYSRGDGVFYKNFLAYGDTSYNPALPTQGSYFGVDSVGVFAARGAVYNEWRQQKTRTLSVDADFSAQIENHLLEIGSGVGFSTVRYILFNPRRLAVGPLPLMERFIALNPYAFGYWLDEAGNIRETSDNEIEPTKNGDLGPKKPVIAYGYIQDRYELKDLVLNLGVRFDYLDTKAKILRNELLPYGYGDPTIYDAEDFVTAAKEFFVSPRIGLGFPVTSNTVFHAQWGKFIQNPELIDLYTTVYDLEFLASDDNWSVNTGHVKPEKTTQYEVGFRQILGDNTAALGVTAFYKNTEDLTNQTVRFYQRQAGGQLRQFFAPSNYDFGTIKGLALTLDIRKISYFTAAFNYTLSYAEGTGSSTTSSYVAAFRNPNGEIPIVIAPLDFDQRHTGSINVGFITGPGQLGIFENLSLNVLATFNSGRPYTPLYEQDLIAGTTNYGDTKGYVNSAYGPGSFLMSLKLEKMFKLSNLSVTPYIWIENLLDAENAVTVYRSTGSPYTTAWLETPDGMAAAKSSPKGVDAYRADFSAYERDPNNFGIPRQIRLGLKINFLQ
jgi:hypothetical protein